MVMNEDSVRMLLDRLADTEAPPARVDIGLARRKGRRRLRIRRAGAPAAAALAVITIIAVVAAVTGSQGRGTITGGSHPVMPASAPKQFNPMVPYASFGWLPAGFSMTPSPTAQLQLIPSIMLTTRSVRMSPVNLPADRRLDLTVYAAGVCRVTAKGSAHVLSCGGPGVEASSGAPSVNGRPAFWAARNWGAGSYNLVWEYAPNAWATLDVVKQFVAAKLAAPAPVPSQESLKLLLLKVAAHVRYGVNTPVVVPFQLTGVPAGWRAQPSGIQVSGAQMSTESLFAGPSADPVALNVVVTPAAAKWNAPEQAMGQSSCKQNGPASSYVTLDGARGVLFVEHGQDRPQASLCFNNVHGLSVYISLDLKVPDTTSTALPGGTSLGGVTGVFRHMRLLGNDPVNWTADPLLHS
jgi:hypothetical protein